MSRLPLCSVRAVIQRTTLSMPTKGLRCCHLLALVLTRVKVQAAIVPTSGLGILRPVIVDARAAEEAGAQGIEIATSNAILAGITTGPLGHTRGEVRVPEGRIMRVLVGVEAVIGTVKTSVTPKTRLTLTIMRSRPPLVHRRNIVAGPGTKLVFWRLRGPSSSLSGRLRPWPRRRHCGDSEKKADGTIVFHGGEGASAVASEREPADY